jgi:Phosphotransferase enzyme family
MSGNADDALGWAVDILTGMGREVVAEPMTLKDRAWSRVVRLTTADGPVWLKVNRGATTYEPAVVEALGRLTPASVDEPLAVAGAWMLTSDGGPTLRDIRGDSAPDLAAMSEMMREYAALQRATAPHVDRLLALRVPDLRPAVIPAAFDHLLSQDDWMRVGRDGGISAEAYARLLAHRPVLADACARLAESPIPVALQHDDLHDNNVFVPSPGVYRIFDWGDACISHPFGTLLVSLRSFAVFSETTDEDPKVIALRDAYLECWTDLAPLDQLVEDALLAIAVAPVGRALSWQRALVDAGPEERAEWQDSVWGWLEELLPSS